jgi:drug/metabolite transporter (DMT)-like permease
MFKYENLTYPQIFIFFRSYLRSMQKMKYAGMGLAVLAVLIWSGNFIVARGIFKQVPPISLAFYRWLLASVLIVPFAIRSFRKNSVQVGWKDIRQHGLYLFGVALTGITFFNTFVYIGAHSTTAINLALIGTTTSPVFAVILAGIFLKEKNDWWKITGMILCISGVLFLLAKGRLQNLLMLEFSSGDAWVLLAGLSFAVYTTLVRRKPAFFPPVGFLLIIFILGTILLFPAYLWEISRTAPVVWNRQLLLIILFLGLGASVISFLCWNVAVSKLGAGRTALFGNLIPVFTSIQATFILNEKFTTLHIISMLLVFFGIMLANRHVLK